MRHSLRVATGLTVAHFPGCGRCGYFAGRRLRQATKVALGFPYLITPLFLLLDIAVWRFALLVYGGDNTNLVFLGGIGS